MTSLSFFEPKSGWGKTARRYCAPLPFHRKDLNHWKRIVKTSIKNDFGITLNWGGVEVESLPRRRTRGSFGNDGVARLEVHPQNNKAVVLLTSRFYSSGFFLICYNLAGVVEDITEDMVMEMHCEIVAEEEARHAAASDDNLWSDGNEEEREVLRNELQAEIENGYIDPLAF